MTDADQLRAFVALVDAALKAQGRTRTDLALTLGVSPSRISHLLRGHRGRSPTLRTLRTVAMALGMKLVVQLEPEQPKDPVDHYFGGA